MKQVTSRLSLQNILLAAGLFLLALQGILSTQSLTAMMLPIIFFNTASTDPDPLTDTKGFLRFKDRGEWISHLLLFIAFVVFALLNKN